MRKDKELVCLWQGKMSSTQFSAKIVEFFYSDKRRLKVQAEQFPILENKMQFELS